MLQVPGETNMMPPVLLLMVQTLSGVALKVNVGGQISAALALTRSVGGGEERL